MMNSNRAHRQADRATRPTDQAPAGLGDPASVPCAAEIANASDFLVEKGIPIPPVQKARVAKYGAPKYPWEAMLEGDSFLVPGDGSAQQQIRVSTASNVRARKNAGENYITRVVPGGVRVWRVPASARVTPAPESSA